MLCITLCQVSKYVNCSLFFRLNEFCLLFRITGINLLLLASVILKTSVYKAFALELVEINIIILCRFVSCFSFIFTLRVKCIQWANSLVVLKLKGFMKFDPSDYGHYQINILLLRYMKIYSMTSFRFYNDNKTYANRKEI